MRRARPGNLSTRERLVGIATEPVSSFGRSVLWGVIKYANLQRTWVLHKDMWRVSGGSHHWPDCDGTVIGGIFPEVFPDVKKHSRHLITCSGSYDPNEMPSVCLDDAATAAMAAEHLIERGLRHFGLYGPVWANDDSITGRPRATFVRRARGYQQTLQKHGFSCIRSDAGSPTYEDFLTHAHHPQLIRWLRSLPTPIGIMAVDDTYANDLAEACREAQIGVPNQVAIIGINNDELLCESAWPPLSSVECNFTRMGYLAAKMLDRMMNGEKIGAEERLIQLPPIRVHQRMSTDVLAIDQPEVAEAVRYIREHACDPCSVKELMKAVPVSRRTLERQFVDRLGRSLHDEISRVRVETARRLLTQPDLPIDEIGRRCGFSAVQSFNRFFHQVAGITPAAFRRQTLNAMRAGASVAKDSDAIG